MHKFFPSCVCALVLCISYHKWHFTNTLRSDCPTLFIQRISAIMSITSTKCIIKFRIEFIRQQIKWSHVLWTLILASHLSSVLLSIKYAADLQNKYKTQFVRSFSTSILYLVDLLISFWFLQLLQAIYFNDFCLCLNLIVSKYNLSTFQHFHLSLYSIWAKLTMLTMNSIFRKTILCDWLFASYFWWNSHSILHIRFLYLVSLCMRFN